MAETKQTAVAEKTAEVLLTNKLVDLAGIGRKKKKYRSCISTELQCNSCLKQCVSDFTRNS